MKDTAFSVSQIDSVLNDLETRLLPNLRYRRPDEIPGEPGFCIENGFIADDGKRPQYEDASITFHFKQWPDVAVTVLARTNGDKLEEPLLGRVKKPIPEIFAEVVKQSRQFRQGKRAIGPFPGEENLRTYPTDNGYDVHRFVWESQGQPRANFAPRIHFEFGTGYGQSIGSRYMPPSLTDEQAIKLFDAIVSSIRLRPTTPGKTSDAGSDPSGDGGLAKRLPLGTQVSSLRACPESGVYACPSDAPGVVERRIFIERHRPMPGAFVIQSKQGIAGIFGGQALKETETLWTLVAYERD